MKNKSVLSVVVAIAMMFSLAVPATAAEPLNKENAITTIPFQHEPQVTGNQGYSLDSVISTKISESSNIAMSDFSMSVIGDRVFMVGQIVGGPSATIEVETYGIPYRFLSASGKETYLIDFEDNSEIHFVQARINEGDGEGLHLILQMYDSKEYVSFDIPCDTNKIISAISGIAITDDAEKAFDLYNISKNTLSNDAPTATVFVSHKSSDGNEVASPLQSRVAAATYDSDVLADDWEAFFSILDQYGEATLSEVDIDDRIVTNTGWVMLRNSDVEIDKYSLACYTAQNGSYEKLVQITYLPLVHQGSDPDFASLYMKYQDSVYLSYNQATQTFDVLMYDLGPTISGLRLGLTLPSGASSQTVFISKKLEASLDGFDEEEDTLSSVIALVPYASTAFDIWNILASDGEPTEIGVTEPYEDTFEKQKKAYGDNVYRAIAGEIAPYEMTENGHRLYIEGKVYAGYENCSGWEYEYTASSR